MRFFQNPHFDDPLSAASKVTKSWLKEQIFHIAQLILSRKVTQDDYLKGIYVSASGDGYGIYQAGLLFPEKKEIFTDFCINTLDRQLHYYKAKKIEKNGYLLGVLGVHVVRAIITFETQGFVDEEFLKQFRILSKSYFNPKVVEADEILAGRAGFLAAVLILRLRLKHEIISEEKIKELIGIMINIGREHSRKYGSQSRLMYSYHGKEYLGAAHGLMGILQMLLSFSQFLESTDMRDIEESLDWLLSIQLSNGNFPTRTEKVGRCYGDDELIHWCHGATGAVHLFIVAYLVFQKEKYLKAAEKCLELIWAKGVLSKGPGICHGVAGSGYAFLLYYRLTRNEKYLNQARCFASIFCDEWFKSRARTPDHPYSLFEGVAGSLCFLCDLYNVEGAQFPLIPIPFSNS